MAKRELEPADIERSCIEMMARDHARMRRAGGRLAEAAVRVITDYDGLHRLSMAVAEWSLAVADEGDRAAIADRNGNRRDRETGLGPKDESGGAGTAIAQPQGLS